MKKILLTAYPGVGPEVRLAGGYCKGIAVDQALVDGNLITAPAWPAHPEFLKAFLHLQGTEVRHKQKEIAVV